MLKGLLTSVCLLLIFSPSASAQSAVYSEHGVFENLCAPEFADVIYEEPTALALAIVPDDNPLPKVRIGLLERGFNPGFDLDAVDADERLAEAIRGFQSLYSLPVTGQVDDVTFSLLRVF